MITHIVMLKLNPGVPSDEIDTMYERVLEAKLNIPEVKSMDLVKNMAIPRRSLDFDNGFVMTFDNESALNTYYGHPAHKVLSQYLRGIAELYVLDYEIETI